MVPDLMVMSEISFIHLHCMYVDNTLNHVKATSLVVVKKNLFIFCFVF